MLFTLRHVLVVLVSSMHRGKQCPSAFWFQHSNYTREAYKRTSQRYVKGLQKTLKLET